MTYIIGFRQPGLNAILADTLATCTHNGVVEHREGDLKLGLLFPGCVYGSIGSSGAATSFIRRFKESIYKDTDRISGFWQQLCAFIKQYPFPSRRVDHFQLLLSHRGLGDPRFAKLDSFSGLEEGEIPHSYFMLAYGSGCEILNDDLTNIYTPQLKIMQRYLLDEKKLDIHTVHAISPYFLCLWLCEKSLTFEKSHLATKGVGGVFHFIQQTASLEATQHPALYLFSAVDRTSREIRTWLYRVSSAQGGLYVESHAPPDYPGSKGIVNKLITFDVAARYDVLGMPENKLRAVVEVELASQPFYRFCGFGFTDPSERRGFGFMTSTNGKRQDLFDEEGHPTPKLQAHLIDTFELGR